MDAIESNVKFVHCQTLPLHHKFTIAFSNLLPMVTKFYRDLVEIWSSLTCNLRFADAMLNIMFLELCNHVGCIYFH